MNILIVGAGAVGQVYGHHLARGGAHVTVFVRDGAAAMARAGYPLVHLNRWKAGRRGEGDACAGDPGLGEFTPQDVFTSANDVRQHSAKSPIDQVWLCVSSSALTGEWLPALLDAAGPATVVLQQPGLEDRSRLLEWVPEERIVQGLIMLISYASPLPGTRAPIGTSYFLPPLIKTPFSGARARDVVALLKAGSFPATAQAKPADGATKSAFMMPLLSALELCDWRFEALRVSEYLGLGIEASREAVRIAAAYSNQSSPLLLRAVSRTGLIAPALFLAPRVAPLPVEAFFAFHFKKTRVQTREMMATYIREGLARMLPVGHLQELEGLVSELG